MIVALSDNNIDFPVAGGDSDLEHFRNFSNGDNNAFYSIFRKYEQPLLKYIYGFTLDPELSKDICQETFLQLINRPPLFLMGDSLKPWLFKVARNKSLDALRSLQSRGARETELFNQAKPHDEHPSEFPIHEDELRKLHSALRDIPEAYREIVSMHIYGKMTFTEISKFLGIPLGTALWRMQKALSLLKEQMEKNQ